MILDPTAILVVLAAVVFIALRLEDRFRLFRSFGAALVGTFGFGGIEGPAGGEGSGPGTLAVELFYGWAPYDEPSPDRSAWKTGGINIILRAATF